VDTPKLLETPNTVPYPIIYDQRRLSPKINFLNFMVPTPTEKWVDKHNPEKIEPKIEQNPIINAMIRAKIHHIWCIFRKSSEIA
jgi:hypothetical protein